MKKTRYPTHVNLKDLPFEGESFQFSNQTGELNKALSDMIGEHPFQIDLTLTPAGNAYEIAGHIESKADLLCARCGRDLTYHIHDDFHELIVVMKERPRSGHSGHTGNNLIDGPYCNYTTNYDFDLAEFAHEHIAAAIPYTPYCERSDCETYLTEAQKSQLRGFDEEKPNNPFEALKNFASKSQRS
jgi:uncharacterized metal-binding protein YceD (DUF177 family)